MKPQFLIPIIFMMFPGCQRKTNPLPKTCQPGQIRVGDQCGENRKGDLDTTPEPRPDRTPEETPPEERTPIRPDLSSDRQTGTGEPSPDGELPRNPNVSDQPYQPPAPTPEELASRDTAGVDSVDSYKDLQVNVIIKALAVSDGVRGPLGLYVKLSKPELVGHIYVQYMKGEVLEGEKAFAPWDIYASIKFNAGAFLCEVSETRFDWETYRIKEAALSKPVPYSCRKRSTN
jgi:hypothetical protein